MKLGIYLISGGKAKAYLKRVLSITVVLMTPEAPVVQRVPEAPIIPKLVEEILMSLQRAAILTFPLKNLRK